MVRIYENSLSGIANHYVVLEPGPADAPQIRRRRHDHPEPHVLVRQPRPAVQHADPEDANRSSQLHPGRGREHLRAGAAGQQDAPVLRPGALEHQRRDRRARAQRAAVRQPAGPGRADDAGARRRAPTQLTELVANTNATTAAIASQSQNLEQTLRQLGPTLTHSTATFAGLRSTLDVLQPLVVKSIPQLAPSRPSSSSSSGKFTTASIPTIDEPQRADPQPHRQRRSDHAAAGDARRWPTSPSRHSRG